MFAAIFAIFMFVVVPILSIPYGKDSRIDPRAR
jgi:hypothetical protein